MSRCSGLLVQARGAADGDVAELGAGADLDLVDRLAGLGGAGGVELVVDPADVGVQLEEGGAAGAELVAPPEKLAAEPATIASPKSTVSAAFKTAPALAADGGEACARGARGAGLLGDAGAVAEGAGGGESVFSVGSGAGGVSSTSNISVTGAADAERSIGLPP